MPDLMPLDSSRSEARSGDTRPSPSSAGAPRLAILTDDGRQLVIEGQLAIGSAADNTLVFQDPFVSAHHCVISRVGQRSVLVDCGSRNGTWLAGARVTRAELHSGTRVLVGQTQLRIVTPTGESADDASMIGRSAALRRLRKELGRVAVTRHTVLIQGETGTGKELAARAVHVQSRRKGAFVALNCGAISPELVESELFGHERGAFTGATGRRPGVFEEADGGTLFLDEIGELPLSLQPRLLRALETGTIRAVGATGERRVDVRVVAATHRHLLQAVSDGNFREDLYHRLAPLPLLLPPLRERREDIPALAQHFLEEHAAEMGVKVLSEGALTALTDHPWPGNVRELKNAILRGAVHGGTILSAEDVLPPVTTIYRYAPTAGEGRLDELERAAIARALRHTNGNRRAAATVLGVPKSTLCDKVKRYGITVGNERDEV